MHKAPDYVRGFVAHWNLPLLLEDLGLYLLHFSPWRHQVGLCYCINGAACLNCLDEACRDYAYVLIALISLAPSPGYFI